MHAAMANLPLDLEGMIKTETTDGELGPTTRHKNYEKLEGGEKVSGEGNGEREFNALLFFLD